MRRQSFRTNQYRTNRHVAEQSKKHFYATRNDHNLERNRRNPATYQQCKKTFAISRLLVKARLISAWSGTLIEQTKCESKYEELFSNIIVFAEPIRKVSLFTSYLPYEIEYQGQITSSKNRNFKNSNLLH